MQELELRVQKSQFNFDIYSAPTCAPDDQLADAYLILPFVFKAVSKQLVLQKSRNRNE